MVSNQNTNIRKNVTNFGGSLKIILIKLNLNIKKFFYFICSLRRLANLVFAFQKCNKCIQNFIYTKLSWA
jgi:hypothetical protein